MSDNKEFVEFSTLYGVELREVELTFSEEENKLIGRGIPLTDIKNIAWGIAKRKLFDKYGVSKGGSTPTGAMVELEGYLIGAGEFRDRAQELRNRAEKAMDNDKGEALAHGLIDREGRVLDNRAKLFGKPNPDKGKPLDPSAKWMEMGLYGAFRVKDTDDPFVYTRFQTSDNVLAEAWAKIQFPQHAFKPCLTYGKIRVDKYGYMIYGLTGSDNRTVFRGKDVDISVPPWDAIREALGMYTVPPVDAYDVLQTYIDAKTKKLDWNRLIAVEGIITDIQLERKGFWKGIPAKLWDLNDALSGIDLYLPDTWDWDNYFGEYTIGIAYGKPDEVMMKDGNTGEWNIHTGKVEIRCMGFYPLPGMITQGSQHTLGQSTQEYVGFVG